MLGSSAQPLCQAYDLAMLDLDGVVYVGGAAVPDAPQHLARARTEGLRVAFVTNNASRPPASVAEHLRSLEVDADEEDVVTSAQAAARLLADRHDPGARVVSLGADGLREALAAAGLTPVGADDDAEAIATGYGPDVRWSAIMRAAVRIRDGLPWSRATPTAPSRPPSGSLRGTACRSTCCAASPVSSPRSPASRPGPSSTRRCDGWEAAGR